MDCPLCHATNIQQLRGYWESLPAESPHRGKYAPPDAPDVQPWVALLALGAGIWLLVTGAVLIGLLVAVAGLVWGAFMAGQQRKFEADLATYNASTICLVRYHIF
ncbi:hypothetical protein OIE52_39070 [Streptomyces canus]|uniref:hypothetical protein n=1 Tax=Streptomyces canus TaxID=58343 RepID=UPI0032540531